jgi:S-DNA-T family DNA segregation ATPase FtsK/SpoIIIE
MVKKRRQPTRKVTPRRHKSKNANQAFDIVGISLIFFGVAMLVCLAAPKGSGAFGGWVDESLRSLVGVGAWLFPFLCALVGVLFILGPIAAWSRNVGIGAGLIFISFLGWKGLVGIQEGIIETATGGIIGQAFAMLLKASVGAIIGKILLALMMVIGVYITFDIPLANIIERIRDMSVNGAMVARERLVSVGADRGGNGSKPEKVKPGKPLPEEPSPEPEQKRRLLPIFVRKGDPEAEKAPVEPDKRAIPVSVGVGHAVRPSVPMPEPEPDGDIEQAEFRLPPLSLLSEPQPPPQRMEAELKSNVEVIERTLEEFKVSGDVVEIAHGPTVTRYEIRLAPGIKVNKIVSLADNLAMSLAAIDVRVEAPIPGKSAIGVEVPNKNAAIVGLREVIDGNSFRSEVSKLFFALGKDVSGEQRYADLAKMPHMLVAGSTNSGKSICLNTLIASLLYRATPDELKLILIDPKRVELSLFEGIPHLACPVVKDARQAAGIFRAATKEMDSRYDLIARAGCRNITSYNEKQPEGEKLPYLVIVCDELADLMMQAAAEVETSICRLAQLARAVGIHLVIATQRPSVDVVTGLIKANISSRIAFAVSSQVDSRTIIDQNGAERLIGRGDMLFLPIDAQKPARIQGCYVSEDEIHRVVDFLKAQRKPVYTIEATDVNVGMAGGGGDDGGMTDPVYQQAVRMIVTSGYASTSMIQRKFKIGYTRAARLVDAMEQQGIVGPLDGAKPREVLINREDLERLFGGPSGLRDESVDEEEE